jgi:hypothetical protein
MGVAFSSPHRAVLGGLLIASPTGSFYGFSVYSEALKQQFDLTQGQMANINTWPYAFGFLGPAAGYVTTAFGPAVGCLIGGIIQATGQMTMYSVAMRKPNLVQGVQEPAVALVCAAFITFGGMIFNSGAAFSTPVQHFPRQRGAVTSLVKSFVGLSGAVVTQAFVLLYGTPEAGSEETLKCLVLWACVTLSCCITAAALVPRRPDPAAAEPVVLLKVLFVLIAALGFFVTGVSLLPPGRTHDLGVMVMLILALSPILVIFWPGLEQTSSQAAPDDAAVGDGGGGKDARLVAAASRRGSLAAASPVFEATVSLGLREMLQTLEAWLLLFVGVVVVGGGTVLATNMAQIIASAGASAALVPTCVTLFSTGNLLGRLLCMGLSDTLVRSGRSRADFLVLIALTMGGCHLGYLVAVATAAAGSPLQTSLLVASSSGAGLAFGAIWPHFVVCASEIFGSEHLPTNYMFYDGVGGALGAILLANLLPSSIYQASAVGNVCDGAMCFGPTHAILAALCVLAMGASLVISRRSASLYQQIAAATAIRVHLL